MDIVVRPDAQAAAALAARLIGVRVRAEPAEMHAGGLSFRSCTTFNLDEYVGLSATDPNSYRATMNRLLFDRIDVVRERTHVPDGMAADLVAEAARSQLRDGALPQAPLGPAAPDPRSLE